MRVHHPPSSHLRHFSLPAFLAIAAVWAAAGASAQTAAPGLVVAGRVAASESRWDEARTLHTYVTIDVSRVVVGVNVPERLVLKQLGGEAGGIGLWIAGQAAFRAHEDVLLDLEANSADGTLRTRGLSRGKWSIETDTATGTRVAVQPGAAGVDERLDLPVLEAQLTEARLPLAAFTATPSEYAPSLRAVPPLFSYLPTDGGFPARWHEVDSGTPVFVDRPALPGTWTHATPQLVSAAIGLWSGSGMDLDLRAGATNLAPSDCPALSFTGNGRIALAFNDPCAGNVNDWVIGGGYYTVGDLRTVNGTTFQKFLQGFVVLDNTGPQTTSPGCFQDAITHGLGHALGLGHSGVSGAIMNAAPPDGCASGPSSLGNDDRSGITAIYDGIASGAAPPATPTAFNATSSLSTVTMAWTPASTGGAAQRFLIDAGQSPGNYNLGTLTVNAPAVSTSVPGAPPGTYYVRVRAQNVLGTSAPSLEQSVTVGACTPPGAPATFTATSDNQTVNLQWTAPTSGLVQGYQVIAGSTPGSSNLAVLPFAASVTSLTGSVPFGRYYVRVLATNVCGSGPPTPEQILNVQPCTGPPSSPTGLSASVTAGVVTLTWNAPAGTGPTGYTLIAGRTPGAADVLVYPTGSTATSLVASAPRGTYYVRVAASNACGVSGQSNEFVVVVP